MKPQISIIIPFLNEEENIPNLVAELNNYLKNFSFPCQVIFVDDGSKDNSVNLLRAANHEFYDFKIVKLSKNFGSHAALRAGITVAEGQYITFMYADLQDPLEIVGQLYDKLKESGADIIWGNRETVSSSFGERTFSQLYAALMKKYAVNNFPANGFDIVFFNNKVQKELNDNVEPNSSIFLQILTLGFKHAYISYKKRERKAGKSKWTLSKKIKLIVDSFVSFSFAPIRWVTIVGISMFIFGICWALYIILRALLLDDLSQGWPTLVSILMIGFGITNVSLGIIAEYLWRTLDVSRNRKVFIIDEIFGKDSVPGNH